MVVVRGGVTSAITNSGPFSLLLSLVFIHSNRLMMVITFNGFIRSL